ncbi:MAG TPA: hypothetical protein DCY37_07555, partial [Acidaminococcaceae bacterium]|nr:hypothetical protein [Acidaminococcaceae bacterium]
VRPVAVFQMDLVKRNVLFDGLLHFFSLLTPGAGSACLFGISLFNSLALRIAMKNSPHLFSLKGAGR